jgi:ABC transport system ATP-binding/permease protein
MSVIVAIFMGLTVSAEEIIKDRKILKREAFLDLSWNSYLMSKVTVQFGISAIQAFTFVIIGNSITEIKGMWFQYWIILFSCWTSANIMGLIISDTFKAVATIYMWIPFLVIPQIILSGVMVKYDKLNPKLSSPVSIPVYGEIITARWGYEALAVNQFKNNRYEKQYYELDKVKSQGNYYANFWAADLLQEIDNTIAILNSGEKLDISYNIELIRNEVRKAVKLFPVVQFEYEGYLTPEKVTTDILSATRKYIAAVKSYNRRSSDDADIRIEAISKKAKEADKEGFNDFMYANHNKKLEEFVLDKATGKEVNLEYKGKYYQNITPIFKDPDSKFIKAHFYAPVKFIFGLRVDTLIVNALVLWVITILLYLVLYFRLFKKLLDSSELLLGRSGKSE